MQSRKSLILPRPNYDSHFVDIDPRPKTAVCHICARDYLGKCICVPSQPLNARVTNV